jgi:NAD(P)-dependent dehydrogenase (short-subunit alcohol dehydrogenase family)
MLHSRAKDQKILITGGTSGLGFELVRLFLEEGFNVVATGRQQIKLHGSKDRLTLYNVDFEDLKQVAAVTKNICRDHSFSFMVNNAGILSPPEYTETIDGLECTFQINFLAHLLINEIILSGASDERHLRIVSVTSPVYRLAVLNPYNMPGSSDYRAMRSYSSSKLYLTMLCEILSARHGRMNLECFSFDPGTFSSGIYRTQKRWFRQMYGIAAPFMRSPARIAKVLADLMLKDSIDNGAIYDSLSRKRSLPEMDKSVKEALVNSCFKLIDPFLT